MALPGLTNRHAKIPILQEIDQLVYELYGLTDEGIRIVEEATR